jgi:hypothetical protein
MEKNYYQELVRNISHKSQERILNQESTDNSEQLNEATTSINKVQQDNAIENNERPYVAISTITQVQPEIQNHEQLNEAASSINQVQQDNEIENNERPYVAITTLTQVQPEIQNNEQLNEATSSIITTDTQVQPEIQNYEQLNEATSSIIITDTQVQPEIQNNEQLNEATSSINQVQQDNEIENNERTNKAITTITQNQRQIEELIIKTPKLLREIKMRDKTVECPHTRHSFFCYCKRPELTPEFIKQNKKILISNDREKQLSTNSIDRIIATYNTIYGDTNTCLPNEFYPLVLRKLIDIELPPPKINLKRKRREEQIEIGSITQKKMPLDTELDDEIFQKCRNVIDGFDITLWFHDKDKVNN